MHPHLHRTRPPRSPILMVQHNGTTLTTQAQHIQKSSNRWPHLLDPQEHNKQTRLPLVGEDTDQRGQLFQRHQLFES